MTSMPNALTILESIAGYNQLIAKGAQSSANATIKLAVIDPAYSAASYPGTMPKVTFEGESTLSDKRYPVTDRGYCPGPGDRVLMIPVASTYVIAGVVSPAMAPPDPYVEDPSTVHFAGSGEDGKVIQTGTKTCTITSGAPGINSDPITFSPTFGAIPRVWLTWNAIGGTGTQENYAYYVASIDDITTSGANIRCAYTTAGNLSEDRQLEVHWLAIGPP